MAGTTSVDSTQSGSESTAATEFRTLNAMAIDERPAARRASPTCVNTEDLPTSSGHPLFERLNRILVAASGLDTFVDGLCTAFYAAQLGRVEAAFENGHVGTLPRPHARQLAHAAASGGSMHCCSETMVSDARARLR